MVSMSSDEPKKGLSLFSQSTDQETREQGERDFSTALYYIQDRIDPSYSFIIYRFNRTAINHEKLDSALFIDEDDVPCFGVNFENFHEDLTPLARIGTIEHNVGHLISGHLGDRLGYQLREYCELKYGPTAGRAVYYMTIETAADSFVSFPGALQDSKRPFYDIRKLGLKRYDPTIDVLRKIEERVPPSDDEEDLMEKLQDLASELTEHVDDNLGEPEEEESDSKGKNKQQEASQGKGSGKGDGKGEKSDEKSDGKSKGSGGQGSQEEEEKDEALKNETGGIPTKDIIVVGSKADAMVGEDKIRNIVREAMEKNPKKDRGFTRGDCSEFIEAADAQPVVPWHKRMNAAVTTKLSEERRVSKLRLNRRVDWFKGRTYENTTSITFVIDTSGSMGSEALSHVLPEIEAIAQHTDYVNVIHCDCSVAKMEKFSRGMELGSFFGRGGTSFTPALEYIYNEMDGEDEPTIIVYFTDGYGEQLDRDIEAVDALADRIIWILTPEGLDEDRFLRDYLGGSGEVIKVEEW